MKGEINTIENILGSKTPYALDISTALNVVYTAESIKYSEEYFFKQFKLSAQQYNVLRILKGSLGTPLSLLELQSRMIRKMSNTTRLVDKLIEKGYVHRKLCEDNRRKVEITITKKGMDILGTVTPGHLSLIEESLRNLSEQEKQSLIQLLEKIRQ